MPSANKSPILLFALLTVVAVLVGGLTLFDWGSSSEQGDTSNASEALGPSKSQTPTRTVSEPVQIASADGDRTQADLLGTSSLRVEVFAPGAVPLLRALVHPTYVGGGADPEIKAPRPKLSPGQWKDLQPGSWLLRVECDQHIEKTLTIDLLANEERDLRIDLLPHGKIIGTIATSSGEPVPSKKIWLLKAGQVHPATPLEGRDVTSLSSDRFGRFSVTLQDEEDIRISVGPPGLPKLTHSGTYKVAGGDERKVDIVLAETARVEVNLTGMQEIAGMTVQAILERRISTNRPTSETKPGAPFETKTSPKTGRTDTTGGPRWIPTQREILSESGQATMNINVEGPAFRLALIVGGARLESKDVFEVRAGTHAKLYASIAQGALTQEIQKGSRNLGGKGRDGVPGSKGGAGPKGAAGSRSGLQRGGGKQEGPGQGSDEGASRGKRNGSGAPPLLSVQVAITPIMGGTRPVGIHWQ
ncbi:MAG: hypothetical protein ACI841_001637 [Planctomycetota bacterium]